MRIVKTREDIKKQYAQSLLKYAAAQNGYLMVPLTFGEPSVKTRIKSVLCFRKGNAKGSYEIQHRDGYVEASVTHTPVPVMEIGGMMVRSCSMRRWVIIELCRK